MARSSEIDPVLKRGRKPPAGISKLATWLHQHAGLINPVLVAVFAIVALIGWHIRQPVFFQLHPDFAPMQYNTALCFLSCSLSLLLRRLRHPRTSLLLALPALLLAGLTLLEYQLGRDIGNIDRLFMEPFVTTRAPFPGRPALLTAISFCLASLALISSGLHSRRRNTSALTAILSGLIIAISMLGFIGYGTGLSGAFSWSIISQMALPTVIGFMALGIGTLSVAWNDHMEISGHNPHWLPLIILVAAVTTTFLLANALRNEENRVIRKEGMANAAMIKNALISELGDRHRSLRRLALRWKDVEQPEPALWQADAGQYLRDDLGYHWIAWADSSLVIRQTAGGGPDVHKLSPSMPSDLQGWLNGIAAAGSVRTLSLGAPPLDLCVVAPVGGDGRFKGLMLAAIDAERFFPAVLPPEITADHHITIEFNNHPVYQSHPDEQDNGDPSWSASSQFHLHGGDWNVRIRANPQMIDSQHNFYSRMVVALGLMVSLLLALSSHLSQVASTKSAEAAERNVLLQQEISERIRSQKQLQLASALNEAIVLHAGYAVITTDTEGLITSFNPAAQRMLGYPAAEMIGKLTPAAFHDPGEVVAHAGTLSRQYATQVPPGFEVFVHEARMGIITQKEWTYIRKDGSRFPVSLAVSALKDGEGRINGFLGVASDISALKQAMAELKKTHEQLVEASLQVGRAEVATNILHNVGNVLNSVNVAASLLGERIRHSRASSLVKVCSLLREHASNLPDFFSNDRRGRELPDFLEKLSARLGEEQNQTLRDLGELDRNIQHIKEIVAMQQNYARSGEIRETVVIHEVLDMALRMHTSALARQNIQLEVECDRQLVAHLEKHKLIQILINLISNAKHACAAITDRTPSIRLSADVELDKLRIRIEDNGEGIAPGNMTRIFTHGFTTKKDGHGFGLHSAAIATREMGGSLEAASPGPDQGAVFTLLLPL